MTDPTGDPPDPTTPPADSPRPTGEPSDPWGMANADIDDHVSLINVRFADVAVIDTTPGDLPDGYVPATGSNASVVDAANALGVSVVRDPFGDLSDELLDLVRFEAARQTRYDQAGLTLRWFVLVGPAGVVVVRDGDTVTLDPRWRVFMDVYDWVRPEHKDPAELARRLSTLGATFAYLEAAGWQRATSYSEVIICDPAYVPRRVPPPA